MKNTIVYIAAAVAVSWVFALRATANVYATNLKVNNAPSGAVSVTQGGPVTVSYILNEPASAGVTVNILSGSNVVRTLSVPSGNGTVKGTNSVLWDGKDGGGVLVPVGAYRLSVTAAAVGYTNWTQISDDTATNSYINAPYGIAVDNNPSSPYYGRVIVGNATTNGSDATSFGNVQGLYKFNADGSRADDGSGSFSLASYDFTDDGGDVPILTKIKEDDRLYFNDWVNQGKVVACDMALTTNVVVLDAPNYSANAYASSVNFVDFQITDILTDHARVYMTDANYPSAGVWYWPLTNGVTDPNDPNYASGYQAVATGGDLSLRADGIIIDAHTNVYLMQNRGNVDDSNMRVCAFTNWDGTTTLFSGAAWVVGGGDNAFRNLRGMALDSLASPKYLAISMISAGTADTNGVIAGGIRLLNPADGTTLYTNLDAANFYRAVNWDNVGNLYAGASRTVGQTPHRWRIFSPPGTNQATTVGLPVIQVTAGSNPLTITSVVNAGGSATIGFSSAASDAAGAFTLQSSGTVTGTYTNTSAVITQLTPGAFQAVIPASGSAAFYRIKK